MEALLIELRQKEAVRRICEKYHLNLALLNEYFILKAKGFNNVETAEKLAVHRVTVQRYSKALQTMEESEFKEIYDYTRRIQNEKTDNASEWQEN